MPEIAQKETLETLSPVTDFFSQKNVISASPESDDVDFNIAKLAGQIGLMDRSPDMVWVEKTDRNDIFFYKKLPTDKHETVTYQHSADIISLLESMKESSSDRPLAFWRKDGVFHDEIRFIDLYLNHENEKGNLQHTAFFERTNEQGELEQFSIPAGDIYALSGSVVPVSEIDPRTIVEPANSDHIIYQVAA